jgi:hypothetical protein
MICGRFLLGILRRRWCEQPPCLTKTEMNNFYRIVFDDPEGREWFLGAPVDQNGLEIDPRLFTAGNRLENRSTMRIPVKQRGRAIPFSFGALDMVVAEHWLADALQHLVGEQMQRFSVSIEGSATSYEIINVCSCVRCVDESRSIFTKWGVEDGRADKVGMYRMFVELKIDPTKADSQHLFRVDEWPIALVASEQVRQIFQQRQVQGVKFLPLS